MKNKNEDYNIFASYTGKIAGFVYQKNGIIRTCMLRNKKRKSPKNPK